MCNENDVGLIITCHLTIFVLNLKEFCLDFEFCVFLDLIGTLCVSVVNSRLTSGL